MPVFLGLFSLIGGVFKNLFGFKQEQAKTVQSALDVLKSVNDVDGQSITAASSALSSILTQGSFLEKNWRPLFMVILMSIVICSFFGYVPSHFNAPVTPMMEKVWTLLQIGLGGYIPCRTIEKIVSGLNIASILKQLIQKKMT